ncbi:hypothetical protein [Cryobacterium shii]|uniref:Transcriptional regulator, AbiEi antitoxin, Type IV TA system n=1 Tax=Cryobacterium shii TaxID=1259235 RepID=A0AAQ2C3K7_9MICO|nr:hypothetical protein [Cryobacterium shii]TFC41835.1 hypothetical protein E3O49_15780 [Cryobacterium shii]
MSSPVWAAADDDARYLLRIQAVVLTRRSRPVLSHLSAARIWGLPVLGRWPAEVHLMCGGDAHRHARNGVVWHYDRIDDDEVVEINGFLVTSRLRTMVDLARTERFAAAVVALDAGLRTPFVLPSGSREQDITHAEFQEAVTRLGAVRGCRGARLAAAFADGQSGSAGESVSRANIYLAGLPAPELQVAYLRPAGGEDKVDFRWHARHNVRRVTLLGEFDGKVKYTRDQYMAGRTIQEVVWDEKVREDRLRAPAGGPDRGMVRWLWDVAVSPVRLRAVLIGAGLRPER